MRGFVLLVVLVYLQIFSLLILQVAVSLQTNKRTVIHQLQMLGLNTKARGLLSKMTHHDSKECLIAPISAHVLQRKPLPWWRGVACHYKSGGNVYYFLSESLGLDSCSVIKGQKNQEVAAAFYRNTLLYLSAVSEFKSVLLQSTIATTSQVAVDCPEKPRVINPGIQVIRELR